MSRLPEFIKHLDAMRAIHERKNEDYASSSNPLENFERSAEVASWFKHPKDHAYVVLIATKLARLATLLNSERAPNNESIDDTFLDLATYANLWWCEYERRKEFADSLRPRIKDGSNSVLYSSDESMENYSQASDTGRTGITSEARELAGRIAKDLAGVYFPDTEWVVNNVAERVLYLLTGKFEVK